jgi:hypothetical protein
LNPDTQQMERYVYVKKEDGYERRPVQIGISDFFYAEVQSGLQPGDVAMLEQPKEELAKMAKGLVGERSLGLGRVRAPSAGSAAAPAGGKAPAPSETKPTTPAAGSKSVSARSGAT